MLLQNDFAEINQSASAMVDWSIQHKEKKKRDYVSLPVMDAPFLRALDVDLSISQGYGIRVVNKLAQDADDLVQQLPLHFSKEAFQPIFSAIDILKEKKEKIVYKIPSLLNLVEGILPFDAFIVMSKRKRDLFHQLIDPVSSFLQEIALDLDGRQVDIIFLFDSFASYRILGPRFYEEVMADKMFQLLQVEGQLEHSRLALASSVSDHLEDCLGFKEDEASHLYLSRQNRQGDIRLLKAVRLLKED